MAERVTVGTGSFKDASDAARVFRRWSAQRDGSVALLRATPERLAAAGIGHRRVKKAADAR